MNNRLISIAAWAAITTDTIIPTPGPNAIPPAIGIQPPHYTGDATDPAIALNLMQIHKGVVLKCACGAELGGCDCHKGRGTPERIALLQARRADALAARGGVA
jgi:hypothetical protein